MTQNYEGLSDWEALRQFRQLPTDTERQEQMFMTALGAGRLAREMSANLKEVKADVRTQNGRVSKLEARWLQSAAVIAFLVVVIPLLLTAVAVVK